jgi:hypothetical protein
MARQFPSLGYGPAALRPLLRELSACGERAIAWGQAEEPTPASLWLFRLGLMVVPGLGGALSMMAGLAMTPGASLLLLTDHRLLVLGASRGGGLGRLARAGRRAGAGRLRWAGRADGPVKPAPVAVLAEYSLDRLQVRVGAWGLTFSLSGGGGPARVFTLNIEQSACAERLCRALALMDPSQPALGERDETDRDESEDEERDLRTAPRGTGVGPGAGGLRNPYTHPVS